MLHDMRMYKSREELSAMRKSARVAIEAHERAMTLCRPGMTEAEIHEYLATIGRSGTREFRDELLGKGRYAEANR